MRNQSKCSLLTVEKREGHRRYSYVRSARSTYGARSASPVTFFQNISQECCEGTLLCLLGGRSKIICTGYFTIDLNLNCGVEVGSALEKHNYFQIINQSASTNVDNLSLIDTRKISNAFHQDFRK